VTVPVWRHLALQPPGSVGLSAVTIEESLRGRLAALARHTSRPLQVQAYSRLALFAQFPLVAFDQACDGRYQGEWQECISPGRRSVGEGRVGAAGRRCSLGTRP
jgi:hypothetical protein